MRNLPCSINDLKGMTEFGQDQPAVSVGLLSVAFLAMLAALYLMFVWVSPEATMGDIQRIFYFHVPAATAAFCAVFVGAAASLLYLKTRRAAFDDLAAAASESVLIFSAINILMGCIWARRAWGIWWTWDARLTSSLILVLIYVGYVTTRKALPIEQRGTVGAVLCIFGAIDVPFIYLSNRLFRTQHPAPVIGGGENSGLDPDMLLTFLVAHVAMLLQCWCIIRLRRSIEQCSRRLESLALRVYQEVEVAR